ncbi:MAG: hypothetical protein KDD67_03205 [Ignavibacteriae bacterium]|nr:hypothetical protein [Ignavibacteriota bacterium]MCB9217161.1 hypothetical protein [Ignavibacteria bacterium]
MTEMKTKEVYRVKDGAFPLIIEQTGKDCFTVTYGRQVRQSLSYGDAAREFGYCLFHLMTCEGRLDDSDNDED